MNSNVIVFDPAKRQILPPNVAVSCPAFTTEDFARSSLCRDILDTIEMDARMPPPPPPAAEVSCESIILEGHEIRSRYTTSGMIVSQQRSVAFATDAPLSIATDELPAPFEREPSLADDAGRALARINLRRSRSPRRPVYEPAAPPSRLLWVVGTVLMVAAFTALWWVLR